MVWRPPLITLLTNQLNVTKSLLLQKTRDIIDKYSSENGLRAWQNITVYSDCYYFHQYLSSIDPPRNRAKSVESAVNYFFCEIRNLFYRRFPNRRHTIWKSGTVIQAKFPLTTWNMSKSIKLDPLEMLENSANVFLQNCYLKTRINNI